MPVAAIESKWIEGKLVFFDKANGTSIFSILPGSNGLIMAGPCYIGGDTDRLKIGSDGNVRMQGTATTWRDMVGDLLGYRLNSTAGKANYDWDENAIGFESGGLITDAADRVQWNQEIDHDYKVGTSITFHPHLHWF